LATPSEWKREYKEAENCHLEDEKGKDLQVSGYLFEKKEYQ